MSALTFSTSSGIMVRARSTVLLPSESWIVRTQPSLTTRNATGWTRAYAIVFTLLRVLYAFWREKVLDVFI